MFFFRRKQPEATREDAEPPGPRIMPLAEAFTIFEELADAGDIAFGYDRDGCAPRAHLIGRRLQHRGAAPGKAWAFERPHNSLLGIAQPGRARAEWWYHVAASADVRMPDGEVARLVFDPGIFDGPVRLEQWAQQINAAAERVHATAWDECPRDWNGNYTPTSLAGPCTDEIAAHTMEGYGVLQEKGRRVVAHSLCRALLAPPGTEEADHDGASATDAFRKAEPLAAAQGRTWISYTPDPETCSRMIRETRDMGEALARANLPPGGPDGSGGDSADGSSIKLKGLRAILDAASRASPTPGIGAGMRAPTPRARVMGEDEKNLARTPSSGLPRLRS